MLVIAGGIVLAIVILNVIAALFGIFFEDF